MTLMRMAWNALNTKIAFGDRTIQLKDIPAQDRLAEVNFVLSEKEVFGDQLPSLGDLMRDGVFNGSIDLLIRPDGIGGPVYILDWKTNSLHSYDDGHVRAAMASAGYALQFEIYTLAAMKWLGDGAVAGVAYLFVRGGEGVGGEIGVFSPVMDAAFTDKCREDVLRAISDGKTQQ